MEELELTLRWEAGELFEMTAKENSDPVKLVVSMVPADNLQALWPAMSTLCERYIKDRMNRILADLLAGP